MSILATELLVSASYIFTVGTSSLHTEQITQTPAGEPLKVFTSSGMQV